jgi:glycosyltransferase involved in cell wall biosynthesis
MKLKKTDVRHIHAHFALDACTISMLISMYTEIPYSFTIHAHDIFIPQLSEIIEEKFIRAKFSASISEYNKNYVLSNLPPVSSGSINVIHCGLDLSDFHQKKIVEKQKLNILAIGRLVEHKGFEYLIEACGLLKKESELNFVCRIVGEGDDRPILEDLIRRFHLSKTVHLLGVMDQVDVKKELIEADLFVLPCVIEANGMRDGIPVVLMEAMAMGIPVISTTVSGIPELIKDGAGVLVEPRNAKELASAIEKILRLPVAAREEMAKKGVAIVEREFNLRKEVQKLAELIKN